jgi:ADP-heptose:LPS heptosyltransferase
LLKVALSTKNQTKSQNRERLLNKPLVLKTVDPMANAAAVDPATSLPGFPALILKAGLFICMSSGLPQKL